MRKLKKEDLYDILYGATFFGSGGGGAFGTGRQLIERFPARGKVTVIDVAAAQPAMSAMAACIGSPIAMAKLRRPTAAVNAMRRLNAVTQGKIGHIVAAELGGVNSILAALTAAELNMPLVDADGARRAIPELTMTTFYGAGLSGNPSVFDNKAGESVVLEIDRVEHVEAIGRPLLAAPAFDGMAGLAMWPMTPEQLAQAAPIQGTLELCRQVGSILRNSKHPIDDLFAALRANQLEAFELARGRVHLLQETSSGGFDFGQVCLKNWAGKVLAYIYNQNENLIAWSSSRDRPLAIAPDSICYVTESGQPFSNDDIKGKSGLQVEGEQSVLIGIGAHPALTGNKKIMQAFRTALTGLGYAGCYTPIKQLQG